MYETREDADSLITYKLKYKPVKRNGTQFSSVRIT